MEREVNVLEVSMRILKEYTVQNFARSQLEVSGVLRCDRSAAAMVSGFVSSKTVKRTPRYRLGDWQDTQQARRVERENLSKEQSPGTELES